MLGVHLEKYEKKSNSTMALNIEILNNVQFY